MLWKAAGAVMIAFILSMFSLQIRPTTSEYAEYGNVGSPAENWRPRLVAGWPAPFVADVPSISVPRQIGPEDEFRFGAFLGTFSFWLLVTLFFGSLVRLFNRH
ncbi:hypothetical protein [Sphingopyxis sp. EG6]|jgi:hypothetical protein|uniref:hypothetical protein n=1 Tax=Sphingopyxis sp. EG6 TaxID=1874061 RepID=UPI000DC6260B|nr:hypothetical protein [Sphingopyxis sp. EG6]BBB08680.1 RNB-like protein [Sphingopyxis sp. EG6]